MGLIAFRAAGIFAMPPFFDDEAFRQSIDELNVNIIPQGGTALAEAIQTARLAFKDKTDTTRCWCCLPTVRTTTGTPLMRRRGS